MKIEIETKELHWWWFDVIHFKIPRFVSKLQTVKYIISIIYDPPPKFKGKESVRDWLKRIPSKYAERYASYKYDQARSCYLEVKKMRFMYNFEKMNDKQRKEYREVLNMARELFSIAEEHYKEVIIRRN